MKKTNKRGFTIVELVIVIAVIAILSAVLIPTFSTVVRKARVNADVQLVHNLNTVLIADEAINGKPTTMAEAMAVVEKSGFSFDSVKASAEGNEILWDSKNNVFCYVDEGVVKNIPDSNVSATTQDVDFWVVSAEVRQDYSTYYVGTETKIITSKGFDAGTSTDILSITYNGNGQADIITNSNDTSIYVDSGEVNHYGIAKKMSKVAHAVYNEYGELAFSSYALIVASTNIAGNVNGNGIVESEQQIASSDSDYRAVIPAGVLVKDGVEELTLEVYKNVGTNANITMNGGDARRSFDVNVSGVSKENATPMTIYIKGALPTGLGNSSVELYHVEGDENTVEMTQVSTLDFTANNQFYYDATTGDVTIYIAGFSEVAAVVALTDPWDGTVDTSWYTESGTAFFISTEEQLAGLGELVANGNDFAGKTVSLTANLDFGGTTAQHIFYPIGYKSSTPDDLYSFSGVFDGGNHTISNLYQNTWNIVGNYDGNYYKKSLGLFAYVDGGTIKNLVLEGFVLEGEFAPTGCVTGRANGGTFENITLHRCSPATYNTGVGGIVGYAYGNGAHYEFIDIDVDRSNTIIALWGSWDVGCGGIMGWLQNSDATINMTNCVVGAKLDVYNDVCANYQYYQYRYCGMLVGTLGGNSEPASEVLNCTNCKVYIGDWADYYYCEFEKNSSASYTDDFQFSRVEEKDIVFDLEGNIISCTHTHTEREDKMAYYLPFGQLYTGYGWGSNPKTSHPGVEVISRYKYTVMYMEGTSVIDVVYVTDNTVAYNLIDAKEGYTWIDMAGHDVTQIPAGNETDVVLYLNEIGQFYARFVDGDGVTIYEEAFQKGATSLMFVPAVPERVGYIGVWPDYSNQLKTATHDIIISPVYSVDENFEILGEEVTTSELFDKLGNGGHVVMSKDMTGKISGGNQSVLAEITASGSASKESSLNLNSCELSYDASHNANKNWTMFHINNDSTLRLSTGASDTGKVTFNFTALNSNARPCMFNIENGGKLILERGVTIEIRFKTSFAVENITMINGVSNITTENYPGLNILNSVEGDYNVIRIIVTGNTTLVGNM